MNNPKTRKVCTLLSSCAIIFPPFIRGMFFGNEVHKGIAMIRLDDVCKTFRVAKRNAGLKHAITSFFRREYHEVAALDHVSFHIEQGEMVGYIGPNGAGKSSTIKVISGILRPDSGSCYVDGLVPWKSRKSHVAKIGVVFGQRSQLWWDIPVADSFYLLKHIYAVDEKRFQRNLQELVEMLAIGDLLKVPTRQLSLGQRMRCEIAASLIHNPKILYLDEPTIGLDAVSKIAVRDFIKNLNRSNGTTVILTTHDMQDIESLTERILLIGKGRILLDGTLSALKERYEKQKTQSGFDPSCDDVRASTLESLVVSLYKEFDIA